MKTSIDWLRFRVREEPSEILAALRPMYGDRAGDLHLLPGQKGILGFQRSSTIKLQDISIGRMDFGGESQKGWVRVDIPGKGCEWVQDWCATDGVVSLNSAQIRRLDIALTTWDGEVTHDRVLQAHSEGKFITGGKPPELRQIVSSDQHAGRTCYIGSREGAKFLRCYEKGFEVYQKMIAAYGFSPEGVKLDGKNLADIYRVELELKPDRCVIPWETIDQRDQYFAGAYPFNAELLPEVEPDVLLRDPKKAPQRELQALLGVIRQQYGKSLYTACAAFQGDIGAVWDQIVGNEHNPRLVEAGVLMVDHDEPIATA